MKRKYLALGLSCALVASLTIAGTLAYLSDKTEKVTNTFTFSDEEDGIHLDLKETVFGEKYDKDGLNEDEANLDAVVNMVPGDIIAKNPTVQATGAECYLFIDVIVENNVAKSGVPFYEYSLATGEEDYTWELVTGPTDGKTSYVLSFAGDPVVVTDDTAYTILADGKNNDTVGDYDEHVDATEGATPVRGSVTINPELTADDFVAFESEDCKIPSLSFVAYAVQSANIKSDEVVGLFLNGFKPVED